MILRIFCTLGIVLMIQTMLPAQDSKGSSNRTGTTYNMQNCLHIFDPAKSIKSSTGYQHWFVARNFLEDGLTVKMSVVGPSQAIHPPHQHSDDEIYFILEGTARFYLNGETTSGSAYSSFYCPPDSEHGISNAGTDTLKYLVIRKYPK